MLTIANVQASLRDRANQNVWDLVGSGVPTNGTSGTGVGLGGPGSSYTNIATGLVYFNTNTMASPTWSFGGSLSAVTGDVTFNGAAATITPTLLKQTSGTISAAAIIGTAAGQLGHANGVILVPAPGAGFVNELVSAIVTMVFGVAAYTVGGNTTINIGGGGAALTGLISNANFIQVAASKCIQYVPLAAVPGVYTDNNPLNLVTSVAPTNPGTAAGTIKYIVNYRVVPSSL